MTPEIFESKWLRKFTTVAARYVLPRSAPTNFADTVSVLDIVVQQSLALMPHIKACQREGKALGLRLPEFEEADTDPVAVPHALYAALSHQLEVEQYIKIAQDMKNGKSDGPRWQDLPLHLRRATNELMEKVQVERERGNWAVDEGPPCPHTALDRAAYGGTQRIWRREASEVRGLRVAGMKSNHTRPRRMELCTRSRSRGEFEARVKASTQERTTYRIARKSPKEGEIPNSNMLPLFARVEKGVSSQCH